LPIVKGGVDTADPMLRVYTTKMMTRRWPTTIFYNMLDISASNALLVWMAVNPEWQATAQAPAFPVPSREGACWSDETTWWKRPASPPTIWWATEETGTLLLLSQEERQEVQHCMILL